jgi:hypothetical protein
MMFFHGKGVQALVEQLWVKKSHQSPATNETDIDIIVRTVASSLMLIA